MADVPQLAAPARPLGGKSPIERACELLPKTLLGEQVWAAYDPIEETIRTQDYNWDTIFARLQR